MKRFVFLASIFFVFFFFGCYDFTNIDVPETVSISSDAVYQLPAGELTYTLREELNVKKLKEILDKNLGTVDYNTPTTENDKVKVNQPSTKTIGVYDYNPTQKDEDACQYIINYPIKEMPLSLGSDTDIADFDFSESFDIPDYTKHIKQALTVTQQSFAIVEGFSGSIDTVMNRTEVKAIYDKGAYIPLSVTAPEFRTMTMRSGSLKIEFRLKAGSSPSSDFHMPVKLKLVTKDDSSKVLSESPTVDCASGGIVTLSLANVELVPEMQLFLDGGVSGGTPLKVNNYDVILSITAPAIAKVTGLTLPLGEDARINLDKKIPFNGMNETLKRASLKSGIMKLACVLPDGWEGVTCKNSQFSFTGGVEILSDKFTDKTSGSDFVRKEADLAGFTLSQKDIVTNGTYIEVDIVNATLVFNENGNKVKFEGGLKIGEIDEIVLDLNLTGLSLDHKDTFDTGLNLSTLFSDFFDGDQKQGANLIQNIEFPNIEIYLYLTQDSDNKLLKSLKAKGSISAEYLKDNEKVERYIVGAEDAPVDLAIKTHNVTFDSLADEDLMITSDVLFDPEKQLYTVKANTGLMTEIMNDHPDDLKFSYSIGIEGDEGSEITLKNEDVKKLKSMGGFKIFLAIVIPLKIRFIDKTDGVPDGKIVVDDIFELTGNTFDEDMLNRKNAKDAEDWLKYTPIIKSVSMYYTIDVPFDVTVSFGTNSGVEPKKLDTSNGAHIIQFTREEIDKLCKQYPLIPNMKAEITAGDVIFARNTKIGFSAILEVQTGGTIKVWDKNE